MTVKLVVGDDGIHIDVSGWFDQAMCVSSGLHLPLAAVTGARRATWDEARADMGLRVGGAYWPGRIATGWYLVRERKGARQWWAVFRDREQLLVIDTTLERPCRVVIAHPDAEGLAAQINQRL